MIDAAAGIGVLFEVADSTSWLAVPPAATPPVFGGGQGTPARAGFGMLNVLIATALAALAISLATSLVHLTL